MWGFLLVTQLLGAEASWMIACSMVRVLGLPGFHSKSLPQQANTKVKLSNEAGGPVVETWASLGKGLCF